MLQRGNFRLYARHGRGFKYGINKAIGGRFNAHKHTPRVSGMRSMYAIYDGLMTKLNFFKKDFQMGGKRVNYRLRMFFSAILRAAAIAPKPAVASVAPRSQWRSVPASHCAAPFSSTA